MARKPSPERRARRAATAVLALLLAGTVLVQIGVSLLLAAFLREKAGFVYAALVALGAAVAIRVYQRPGSPSYKLAWMCLLVAMPVAGMILFCLWGGVHQSKRMNLRSVPPVRQRESERMGSEANLSRLRRQSPSWGRLAGYLQKQGFPVFRNTQARYFSEGADFFADLTERVSQAETYIFLEYYILSEGTVWKRMFEALKERIAAGVSVYVILDDFGSLARLPDDTLRAMREAGIEVLVFNPVGRYVSRMYFNFRDHRKIAVIDGLTAYTGGINVGDEYANLVRRFGHWKDCGVRMDGDAAWGFAAAFMRMWKMLGGTFPNEDDYYRPRHDPPESAGYCQPFFDGPLSNPDTPIEDIYLQIISTARQMLYLTTPYYAVEDSMQRALCIAADAGVDVRLCVPGIPDHRITAMVAETYWGELLRHGVKIYRYTPGFLHGKTVLADRETALIGSTNMDYRTFQLQYECGALFYHHPVTEELLEDLDGIFRSGSLYSLEEWQKRPWHRKLVSSVLRLGAIWL